MGTSCAAHPDDPHTTCELNGNHPICTGWSERQSSFLDWPNADYVPSKAVRGKPKEQLREMAGRVPPAPRVRDKAAEGTTEAMAGSQCAADSLTKVQKDLVMKAIRMVAQRCAEFTADDVYRELADAVPIGKGIAALFRLAGRQKILTSTGQRVSSKLGRDTTRELTIYTSLIQDEHQPI